MFEVGGHDYVMEDGCLVDLDVQTSADCHLEGYAKFLPVSHCFVFTLISFFSFLKQLTLEFLGSK